MRKKALAAAFLFCAVQIAAVSQNFETISRIIESQEITVAQASYLAAQQFGAAEEAADERQSYEALRASGCVSPALEPDERISLKELCALYAKTSHAKGGMMFTLTKKSARYSYREFRAKGYIPPCADPMMSVSGADAIGLLNALAAEQNQNEKTM